MAVRNRLSARGAQALGEGKHNDGDRLWLEKRDAKQGKWVFRYTLHKGRRHMGLGAYPEVSLAEAREKADSARAELRQGLDPLKERERRNREAERRLHTFQEIALDTFEARKADLKGDGIAGRWLSPLKTHVFPKLGQTLVGELDQIDIRDCLAPIWHEKADTARKALDRIRASLEHAAALGLDVDLQAPAKAKALLGKSRHQPKHIPSLPWKEVPSFYASLEAGTVTHLALRLLILTGVRSASIRFMHEDQIDGDIWTIPAEGVKGRKGKTKDFRVPLTLDALSIIDEARRHSRGGFLFPGVKDGVISDATMAKLMKERGMEARPHGFRTSLRVWLAEATDASREVSETMIGHTVGSAVERAYRRTDYLEQRRRYAERWAGHVTGGSASIARSRIS